MTDLRSRVYQDKTPNSYGYLGYQTKLINIRPTWILNKASTRELIVMYFRYKSVCECKAKKQAFYDKYAQ